MAHYWAYHVSQDKPENPDVQGACIWPVHVDSAPDPGPVSNCHHVTISDAWEEKFFKFGAEKIIFLVLWLFWNVIYANYHGYY